MNRINEQVENINNSTELKSRSFDLKEFYNRKEGVFEIGEITGELKKITVTTSEYNNLQKTIIYLGNKQPILIIKEQVLTEVMYLTDGNIETRDLNYITNFFVTNWENGIYEKIVPTGFLEVKENINKNEIEEYVSFAKNISVN